MGSLLANLQTYRLVCETVNPFVGLRDRACLFCKRNTQPMEWGVEEHPGHDVHSVTVPERGSTQIQSEDYLSPCAFAEKGLLGRIGALQSFCRSCLFRAANQNRMQLSQMNLGFLEA